MIEEYIILRVGLDSLVTLTEILSLVFVACLAFSCGWLLCSSRLRYAARTDYEELARLLSIEALSANKDQRLLGLEESLQSSEQALRVSDKEVVRLQTAVEVAHTQLRQQTRFAAERLEILERQNGEFNRRFESIAAQFFVENNSRLADMTESQLNGLLVPLREQLGDFKKRVEDTYDRDSQDRHLLKAEISSLKNLNERISKDAISLTNALRGDNKSLGNWGELVLERVLENAGLQKGREYYREVSFTDDNGRKLRPDVVVHLPGGKHIVVDSKASVKAYEKYVSSDNDEERRKWSQMHVKSLRRHVESLSSKQYELIDGVNSLDFVVMFIPVEAAFQAALELDDALYKDAFDKDVVIVGPLSLMVTCRTIQNVWRVERQNKNSKQIARKAGELIDKFAGFTDELDKIGASLASATETYSLARRKLTSGRGNLVQRAQVIQELGAAGKVTSLSES